MNHESPDETLARIAADRTKFAQATRAFEGLLQRYGRRLLGFVSNKAPVRANAEDLAQDIWLRVWRALPAWKDGHFRGWLFQIARNRLKDALKEAARRGSQRQDSELPPLLDPGASPLDYLAGNELVDRLRSCLGKLRDERRQVIEGFSQGESYEDMATRFARPVNTVKSQLSRAREDLKQCLQLNHP